MPSDSPIAETSEKKQTLIARSGESEPKDAADPDADDGAVQVVGMKRPSSVLLDPENPQGQERAAPENYKKGRFHFHAHEVRKCTDDVGRSNKDATMLSKQATDGTGDRHCLQTNRRSAIAREALKKKIDSLVARIKFLEKENSRYRKEINETSKLFPAMFASNQTTENEKLPLQDRMGQMEQQANEQQPYISDKSTKQQEELIRNLREEIQNKDRALRFVQERMMQDQEEIRKKDHLLERTQQRMKQLWKLLKNAVEEKQQLKNANQHTDNLQRTAEEAQQNYLNIKQTAENKMKQFQDFVLKFQKRNKDLKASEQRAREEKEVYAMDVNDFIASAGDMTF